MPDTLFPGVMGMQFALLCVTGAALLTVIRRIRFLRRCGCLAPARRLYRRTAWCLGLTAYAAMAAQELILLSDGLLRLSNALPLHLCSLMGLLTLPMLLTQSRLLWHWTLYLGMPGAALALLFPAILETSMPEATALAFHLLHCTVFLAPMLPLGLGMRPRPAGAAWSAALLAGLSCAAMGANALTGGNYLFLEAPVAAPLARMARHGPAAYRLALAGCALLVLGMEALAVWLMTRRRRKLSAG